MNEMILTALALLVCEWAMVRHTIPLVMEGLEAMIIDETTVEEESDIDNL